ncbi:hypothetical protein VIBNISOn1_1890023 [Vibrio nigripulchritudo SOn1]|uniref:Uncharacterized protein n=1 Tax=Vibrio nigripulchritudo SOn1 TaxID=1238450 RepID=A0AAV2VQM7_9VIBR|nr:hypothetical protein VIBNISOn1_1890023 [Vibrio nigripulchritudo SOn1]
MPGGSIIMKTARTQHWGYLTPSEFAAKVGTHSNEHNQTNVTKDRLD